MLYVVTAVHNRYEITKKFVEQLCQQTFKEITLVLVDDGSTDGTAEMVKQIMPNAVILTGNGNLWWGGALHMAYDWIKHNANISEDSFCMFANDDTEFGVDYIQKAISILESQRKKVLLTGYGVGKQSQKLVDGSVCFNFKTTSGELVGSGYGNCASTRSLFFRVKDLLIIGGFYPRLLPHYGSDYEWTIRACTKKGYSVFCTDELIYYVNEDTTGDNQYEKLTGEKLFSKRSSSNPFYKVSFILLVTPCNCLFLALMNQVKRDYSKLHILWKILKKRR